MGAKLATADKFFEFGAFMLILQLAPLHAPVQPVNFQLAYGVAVKTTMSRSR